jgi:hypothetical protein
MFVIPDWSLRFHFASLNEVWLDPIADEIF